MRPVTRLPLGERLEARQLLTVFDVATPSAFQAALGDAQDGDEIVLAPGVYDGNQKFTATDLTGVTIRSADANNLAVLRPTSNEAIALRSPERVTIDGLIVEGSADNGINIDDNGQFATNPARDITLRNVIVRDVGSTGNQDAIKLSGVIGFHLDRVQVIGWGERGSAVDMVGCHQGLIENSFFRNDSTSAGSGVRPKGGTTDVTIRANRFEDAGERPIQFGGSTDLPFFRPQPPGRVEADRIVAEGNVIIGSPTATSYVNVDGGASFHHNFVYRPEKWVLRILFENSSPGFVATRAGSFTDNVIVWQQGGLSRFVNIGPGTSPESFEFARNTWFNETDPNRSTPDLPAAEVDAIIGQDPEFDVDAAVEWQFSWGLWAVNATARSTASELEHWQGYRIARPQDDDATFDPRLDNPLQGDWELQPLTGSSVDLAPYSQAILLTQAADFDLDGTVSFADFLILSANFGKTNATRLMGDATRDREVTFADFLVLSASFGTSAA